jgi:hypothetical protein
MSKIDKTCPNCGALPGKYCRFPLPGAFAGIYDYTCPARRVHLGDTVTLPETIITKPDNLPVVLSEGYVRHTCTICKFTNLLPQGVRQGWHYEPGTRKACTGE